MAQEIVSDVAAIEPHVALRIEIARTGVRQFLIAEKIGVSEGQLSRLLSGRKPLTDELAERIRIAIAEAAAS